MKTIVIAVAAIALFASCAFAQYAPEVLSVKGDPKIMKKGSASWAGCAAKTAVADGDRIKTAKGEEVVVGFVQDRKNIIKIGGDSEAVVMSGREPVYEINLLSGEAMALVMSLPEDSEFIIRTPAGLSVARGTGWRSVTDGATATFEAYDNTIYVKGIDADGVAMENETFVDMGYKTVVKKLEQPGPVQKLSPEDIDRWNAWRDGVKDLQAKAAEVSD